MKSVTHLTCITLSRVTMMVLLVLREINVVLESEIVVVTPHHIFVLPVTVIQEVPMLVMETHLTTTLFTIIWTTPLTLANTYLVQNKKQE